ncbi:MAG: DUF2007 domain-containing protein [Acidobacteria bacterium]|uniref:DUF2007 domain-containing protein n=1 Tax=Candidatus Polarisedimenticola svalbardensis TaxID=2886004 RepID=A0A8J7CMQ0_9BACT|nr:DUF2007 domain-containing protein [Candidatus Polarisedimenticola svalbardensis]
MSDSRPDEACVFKASGEFEAQQIKAFLEAHGIQSVLRGEALRNTHGFTLDGLGVVRVLVAAGDEEAALELLQKADDGEMTVKDNDDPSVG